MHVKWSVTFTDRLGPEILTVLETKGQVLHCVCVDERTNVASSYENPLVCSVHLSLIHI